MGVCMLATAIEDRRQTIRCSRARKENDLELFSRGKTMIKNKEQACFKLRCSWLTRILKSIASVYGSSSGVIVECRC